MLKKFKRTMRMLVWRMALAVTTVAIPVWIIPVAVFIGLREMDASALFTKQWWKELWEAFNTHPDD